MVKSHRVDHYFIPCTPFIELLMNSQHRTVHPLVSHWLRIWVGSSRYPWRPFYNLMWSLKTTKPKNLLLEANYSLPHLLTRLCWIYLMYVAPKTQHWSSSVWSSDLLEEMIGFHGLRPIGGSKAIGVTHRFPSLGVCLAISTEVSKCWGLNQHQVIRYDHVRRSSWLIFPQAAQSLHYELWVFWWCHLPLAAYWGLQYAHPL